MTVRAIIDALGGCRLPLSNEKLLQAEVDEVLKAAGIPFEREVRLSSRDVIDGMSGDVGVEIKITGAKRGIYRQLERYAAHDRVATLLLVTNVPMGLPKAIKGKPVFMLDLARAWL